MNAFKKGLVNQESVYNLLFVIVACKVDSSWMARIGEEEIRRFGKMSVALSRC